VALFTSLSCILLIAELVRQPSNLACAEEEATVPKLPFVAEHPDVEETTKAIPTAENTDDMQTFGPADVLCLLVNDAVVTPDSTSSCGDCLLPQSLTSSPCAVSGSKPVSSDVHLTVDTASTTAAVSLLSDDATTLSPHSAGPIVSPVSTGSDEVFVTSCCQNSPSAPAVQQSSPADCAALHQLGGQDVHLPSNPTVADGAFVFEQVEFNKTFEISPLQQLHSNIFDDISRPSSPSESESEPLGGCKDSLSNPDHCISDLCLEDNDSDSIFGTAGFQSPPATDSIGNHNSSLTASTDLFSESHSLALSVDNNGVKLDCSNLMETSEQNVSSFSDSSNVTPLMEVAHSTLACDETHMNSCTTSDTCRPFRSPPKSPVCDGISLYSCITPVISSSPFRSPPRSSASISKGKQMWNRKAFAEDVPRTEMTQPSVDASFSSVLDPAASSTVRAACNEESWNISTEKDGTIIAGSYVHISECSDSQAVSSCDQYTLDWTSEVPAAAAFPCTFVETPVNEVTCNPSENNVQYPEGEIRCQNGNQQRCEVYCKEKATRQASVKQLKCKFEPQQDLGSHVGPKSSPNFDFLPNFTESGFSFKLQGDATHSASVEAIDGVSSKYRNSNAVRRSYSEYSPERASPTMHIETTEAPAGDRQQQSISARMSCFEPLMSGCRKENKRARLSSSSSAVLDPRENQLKSSSHSIGESESLQRDVDGWLVVSPQRGGAKRYQRCSSAGHEDLLALLNIPAASAKNIPRVSERKRIFEVETAARGANGPESAGVVCNSPASSECDQYSCGPQRLSGVDKENSLYVYDGNCQGQVNSRRSLFEGTSVRHMRNDLLDSDLSVELDCRPFKYPVNRIKTKSHCFQTAVPVETSANSFERYKLT